MRATPHLDSARWSELADDCDRALADVHEQYLVQAARVLEMQDDLDEHIVNRGSRRRAFRV